MTTKTISSSSNTDNGNYGLPPIWRERWLAGQPFLINFTDNSKTMLGAIIGDTIGSAYEFHNTKDYSFTLFLGNSAYTDDSIMTMAVAYWLLKDKENSYQGLEDIMAVICDSTDGDVQKAMKQSVETASANRRERIAVVAGGAEETVDELIARAKALNHERVVLVAPGGVDQNGEAADGLGVAAAVAGAIAGESDPAVPLGGAVLTGLYGLSGRYSDGEMDRLILGGVTPVESLAGTIGVVRGVTTRTTTGEAADATWRDLTTIRIVDDVIPTLRRALRTKFQRAKNTAQSRGAIRAQVVLELENKKAREIITGYENVTVTADSQDPARCLVDFSFTVAHGLNQIWLTAHITV